MVVLRAKIVNGLLFRSSVEKMNYIVINYFSDVASKKIKRYYTRLINGVK